MNIEFTPEHIELHLEILRNERECLESVLAEGVIFEDEVEEHKTRLELVKDLEDWYTYEKEMTIG